MKNDFITLKNAFIAKTPVCAIDYCTNVGGFVQIRTSPTFLKRRRRFPKLRFEGFAEIEWVIEAHFVCHFGHVQVAACQQFGGFFQP